MFLLRLTSGKAQLMDELTVFVLSLFVLFTRDPLMYLLTVKSQLFWLSYCST